MIFGNTILVISILLFLLEKVQAADWQGTGNLSKENLTQIWSVISDNAMSQTGNINGFSKLLSDTFNNLWDPAWNVFIFGFRDTTLDVVMMGYAFRNHWMWINNYPIFMFPFSFVIWKDYNCKIWNTFTQSNYYRFPDSTASYYPLYAKFSQADGIVTANQQLKTYAYDDIWDTTWKLQRQMEKMNPSKAYTLIGIPNYQTTQLSFDVGGTFCSSGGAESFIGANKIMMKSSISAQTNYVHIYIVIETRNS